MTLPRLTFYCELENEALQALLTDAVIDDLLALQATLSLGMIDLSPERAGVVRRLNQAGVPVIAWLLLPKDEGYWFNLDNTLQATERYHSFYAWTAEYHLKWAGIGLDIEPDIREMTRFSQDRWRLLPQALRNIFNWQRLKSGRAAYRDLVAQIHSDGYAVDVYQFPILDDERKAGSTLLQRAAGLVDLPGDREVWMLYTSFLRPDGAGFLCSYAPHARSIALGVTGGGVDAGFPVPPPLSWEELARDLRLAWHWCEDIHIFSLEGCVKQGFMGRIKDFTWDYPIILPDASIARVDGWRSALQSGLWLGAHFIPLVFSILGGVLLIQGFRRALRSRR